MGMLDGKAVIITGASRGIGKAIADLYADEGARVVCVARTLNEGDHMLEGSLQTTVSGIHERGGDAIAVQADISEEAGCDLVIDAAHAAFGPVDILVNNAALNYYVPVKDYAVNRWMRAFAVNVHAPFMLSQKVLPDMIAKGAGSIINISSGAALGPGRGPYPPDMPVRGGTMYGASKAALERFTQGLAQEVQQYGVAVSCFSPSAVVPTPGTVYHKLVESMDDPRGEHPSIMAKAALLLATLPLEQITGRVTYSQAILKEHGWMDDAKGRGVDQPLTGYSAM
ncbi:MAG: SDR family NAD(P)-dependent oxidoreductase [Dehalococcoidia bacterium]